MTAATDGAWATLPSTAVIRARTAWSRTLPVLTRQTIESWSPACPGNALVSRLSAAVEPVPGRVRLSEYADPAARPATPRITRSTSHEASTQARCRKHQRAREVMSVTYLDEVISC